MEISDDMLTIKAFKTYKPPSIHLKHTREKKKKKENCHLDLKKILPFFKKRWVKNK